MRILVTGGNTEIPIDQVRVISNIFKGRTGAAIAEAALRRGHEVDLLGNPRMQSFLEGEGKSWSPSQLQFHPYKTFDDLESRMRELIGQRKYDAIIHSAAVSDYRVSQVMTREDADLVPLDRSRKVSSSHEKLYLELVQTPKLIDQVRDWGFRGCCLVKFKLQVGISDQELIEIARRSRKASKANYIVANCLEWSKEKAFIITTGYMRQVHRDQLPAQLIHLVEARENVEAEP